MLAALVRQSKRRRRNYRINLRAARGDFMSRVKATVKRVMRGRRMTNRNNGRHHLDK